MIKLYPHTRHPLWRTPRHHLDHSDTHDHVHWIELFYDLVHVVAIFTLGNFLSHHLSFGGFLLFAGLFTVMWMAWSDVSWFNSLYVSTDIYHRVYMTLLIVTVMICSAAVESLEKSWAFFACAYAVNRFLLAWLYWRARKIGDSSKCLPAEMARNYVLIGGVVLLSAFLPKPLAYYVFGIACLWHWVWFIIPKIGVMRHERNTPRYGHLSERFALLLLIACGEGFFKLVLTMAEKGLYKLSFDIFVNNVIGAISLFTMCWLYYDFVGNAMPKNKKSWTVYKWTTGNFFLMLGVVMMGVALVGEVKVHFNEPYPLAYGTLGCFGLIIYLLALTLIQNNIETRAAHRFSMGKLRWFGIGMALFTWLLLPYMPSIIGNILWGTALFSQAGVTMHRSLRAFAKENDLYEHAPAHNDNPAHEQTPK